MEAYCSGATGTAAGAPGRGGARHTFCWQLRAACWRMLFPPGCHGIFPAFTAGCQAKDGALLRLSPPLRLFPIDVALQPAREQESTGCLEIS